MLCLLEFRVRVELQMRLELHVTYKKRAFFKSLIWDKLTNESFLEVRIVFFILRGSSLDADRAETRGLCSLPFVQPSVLHASNVPGTGDADVNRRTDFGSHGTYSLLGDTGNKPINKNDT